ncbi:hypothetical protein RhiirA5_361982 [Rhizophagus irregularis]|uniref:Uncharacterized protein n=1 Tax=Rhizophagus irregularis TaxID=588596 RepID=A0A2N0PD92_9GLOM|nr:hypothetical protein RhiirA5_361982 [Rhizophagus irregularis]
MAFNNDKDDDNGNGNRITRAVEAMILHIIMTLGSGMGLLGKQVNTPMANEYHLREDYTSRLLDLTSKKLNEILKR